MTPSIQACSINALHAFIRLKYTIVLKSCTKPNVLDVNHSLDLRLLLEFRVYRQLSFDR